MVLVFEGLEMESNKQIHYLIFVWVEWVMYHYFAISDSFTLFNNDLGGDK